MDPIPAMRTSLGHIQGCAQGKDCDGSSHCIKKGSVIAFGCHCSLFKKNARRISNLGSVIVLAI